MIWNKVWVKQLYARFTKLYKSFRSSKAQKDDIKQGMGKTVIRKIYKKYTNHLEVLRPNKMIWNKVNLQNPIIWNLTVNHIIAPGDLAPRIRTSRCVLLKFHSYFMTKVCCGLVCFSHIFKHNPNIGSQTADWSSSLDHRLKDLHKHVVILVVGGGFVFVIACRPALWPILPPINYKTWYSFSRITSVAAWRSS